LESFLWANRELDLKARLFVLTRRPEALLARDAEVEVLPGDVKTFRFPSRQVNYVIHAAVEYENAERNGRETVAANIQGTRRVLELAGMHGTRRVLYTSSGAVYGEQPVYLDRVPEDFVSGSPPANSYARAKLESEALCRRAADSKLAVVIARLFAFVGPYLPLAKNFAIGNFVRDAGRGGPIRIAGDGTPLRSYLYAADLAIWLWTLLAHGESTRPYNVGSDHAISILELARIVERVCGVAKGVSIAQGALPGEKPKRYIPSVERARTELRLYPWVALDEGIRRMFEWHCGNLGQGAMS
jgi:dTDP-glucose 4,6-dehydratase